MDKIAKGMSEAGRKVEGMPPNRDRPGLMCRMKEWARDRAHAVSHRMEAIGHRIQEALHLRHSWKA